MAALPSDSSFVGGLPTDSSSNPASFSSTPPTSISDSGDLANDTPKPEIESVIALLEKPAAASATVIVATSCADTADADTDLTLPSETSRTEPSHEDNTPTRPRRSRHSEPVIYNLAKLSGTAHHGHRRSKGDNVVDRRRRTTAGASLAGDGSHASEGSSEKPGELVQDGIEALDMDWSMDQIPTPKSARSLRAKQPPQKPQPSGSKIKTLARAFSTSVLSRRSTRLSGPVSSSLTEQLASMKPRARKSFEQSHSMTRELKRLADTKEFAKVEEKPVITSIWANGKYYESVEAADAAKAAADAVFKGKANLVTVTKGEKAQAAAAQVDRKASEATDDNSKVEAEDEQAALEGPPTMPPPKRQKKWLEKGLYAGQTVEDVTKTLTKEEKTAMAKIPFLGKPAPKNKALPLPMYNGLRTLVKGRDFKLPYDVCHPLADQPKPKEWRKITKSRFVGESLSLWKKNYYFDNRSTCVCTKDDGCGEDCLNRSVLYECNDTNCNVGREHCQNRAFQDLQDRTKKGGSYRVGVEVVHTGPRGFGVRASRCFEPGQIIMEYAGEIITEEECERRMNEVYKDNEAYYLMSFDQNMILDATTGSIARFVNHSCSPNCRMIKWIVCGKPRMALFAGDNPIMTGEELTYDYNFDPFSAKNVQKCLCGSDNCRGVLGPRTRNDKAAKANGAGKGKNSPPSKKQTVKATVKASKRKLKELLHGTADDEKTAASPAKKRKIKVAVKRSISNAGLKVAKGAKTASKIVKRSVSSITVNAENDTLSAPASGVNKPTARRATTSALLTKAAKVTKKTPTKKMTKGKAAAVSALVGGKKHTPKLAAKSTTAKKSTSKTKATIVAAAQAEETSTPTASPKAKKQAKKTATSTPASRKKAGKGEVVQRREPSPRTRKPTAKALEATTTVDTAVSALKPKAGSGILKSVPRRKSTGTLLGKAKQGKTSGRQSTLSSFLKKASSSNDLTQQYDVPDSPVRETARPAVSRISNVTSPPRPGRKAMEISRALNQVRLVPNDE
ncbi:uncharacterized protein PpBr36_09336 [Pyricularia pennisetigena]|uniref:uncharacterized protein n=1 Tax=Pyricularia pennisetigena TaxID=1578925 RepID=UPI001153B3F2|nr:uncharacterized protein PpBr36_09336 [Pyricularia pennisetigena]TLS22058.1 hypothetical protein PpBr36_09336 [Pyricularia pennisetigena]